MYKRQDVYWISTAAGRVVCRGYSSASAYGGVVYANANHDASNAYASVGSRLAFRGQIVWAQSVSAFKAISEVASVSYTHLDVLGSSTQDWHILCIQVHSQIVWNLTTGRYDDAMRLLHLDDIHRCV